MDELYTVEEMQKILKVSHQTLYRFMNEGKIPFVRIGAHRRFIAKQVMKAIRDMQTAQIHAELYGDRSANVEEKEASQLVPIDTL